VGLRVFFGRRGNVDPMYRLVTDLESLAPSPIDTMPDELKQLVQPKRADDQGGTNGQAGGKANNKRAGERGSDQPAKRPKNESPNSFAQQWAEDIEKTKRALPADRILTVSALARTNSERRTLMGTDFYSLVENGDPCLRYFIFGRCASGKDCRFSHSLKAPPSQGTLQGLKTRIKQRLDEIAKAPKEQGRPANP
jgi:hypothetical protein